MTNEPGLRMVTQRLKQAFESFLKVFNVSLPAPQTDASGNVPVASAPNAIALEIGNELLITDDIIKSHKNLLNSRGRVVIIDKMPATLNALVKASAFGIQVNVGLNEARQMRAAYIYREQTSKST